jgi:pyruvate kinase
MRHLYEVHIVDPENDLILSSKRHIAKSGESAKLRALTAEDLPDDTDYDDLDVIVVVLGDVRDKKEVQEVKILKE